MAVRGPLVAGAALVEPGLRGVQTSAVVPCGLGSCHSQALGQRLQFWHMAMRCSAASGVVLGKGSNLCLLHRQADSLPLSRQGSPVLCFNLLTV